ncbi:MAG: kynureninase, partial [Planctomycetota bacterium]
YFDGNSLGLLCKPAEESLESVLQHWKELGIGGWLDATPPWFDLVESLSAAIADLIGAQPINVTVGNSTTVQLHQLLSTFYDPSLENDKIVIDELAFPTDRYAVRSHLKLRGKPPAECLQVINSPDGFRLDESEIIQQMNDAIQMVILPSVIFTSGQLLGIARICDAAKEQDILVGFDCSHSFGVVPHQLEADQVDFAFGCTYKYGCGGPGAPAWLFIHPKHADRMPGMAGWFGNDKSTMFDMADEFQPADGAHRMQLGTPSILALAPLIGSLDLLQRAGIETIRSASLAKTDFLVELIEKHLVPRGCEIVRLEHDRRGGHVALLHDRARAISVALRDRGFVPDCRPPRILRLCPSPLYTSYHECASLVQNIAELLDGDTLTNYETNTDAIP